MKNRMKLFAIGLALVAVLTLAVGGWFFSIAYGQGPWQGGAWGAMHNPQPLFSLLKTDAAALLQERQAGTSWLALATAKGVSEQALTDALMQPITQMHGWMTQNYPQTDLSQMTGWMSKQIAQDIRISQFGTMTDMHVFGGMMGGGMMNRNGNNGFGGMMGNWNGSGNGGMMGGMMGNWNGSSNGGMMGGMMGGSNGFPNVNATPVPSTQQVAQEINLTARDFKYEPARVQVKKGETVRFKIANQDNFAHNVMSQDARIALTALPANRTTSVLWTAPAQAGTYTVICTFHPGMQFQIVVE